MHTHTCIRNYIMKLLYSRRQRDGALGMVTEDSDSDCQTQLSWPKLLCGENLTHS